MRALSLIALGAWLLAAALPVMAAQPARPLTVSGRGHGIRISLSVPHRTYRRESWIDAVVRVADVSHAVVRLNGYPQSCWEQAYNGSNPIVLEQSARGAWVYPPKLKHVAHCHPPIPYSIAPGKSVRKLIYVPARGPYLIASVLLAVIGKHGKRTAAVVRTPRLLIQIR